MPSIANGIMLQAGMEVIRKLLRDFQEKWRVGGLAAFKRQLLAVSVVVAVLGALTLVGSESGIRKVATPEGSRLNSPGENLSPGTEGSIPPTTEAGAPATTKSGRASTSRSNLTPAQLAVQPISVDAPFKLGVIIRSGEPGRAIGVSTGTQDYEPHVKAMIAELNASNGLGGRKIEATIVAADQTDQQEGTQTRIQTEICVQLTEDKKVDLVISFEYNVQVVYGCYAKHKTPLLVTVPVIDDQTLQETDPWILPSLWMNFGPLGRLLPQVLHNRGFINQSIGIFSWDIATHKRSSKQSLIPAIEDQGGKVLEEVYAPATYDGLAASISSALVSFQTKGINRVIIWAPGGGVWLLFARAAEAQAYRPRYGVSTNDVPDFNRQNSDPNQLRGAVGVGWQMGADTGPQTQPPLTDKEKACFDVFKKRAGITYSSRRNSTSNNGLDVCELFYLSQEAMKPAVGKVFARVDIPVYFKQAGSRYQPIMFKNSTFRADKSDGIGVYAPFAWDEGCGCFTYQTDWLSVPY